MSKEKSDAKAAQTQDQITAGEPPFNILTQYVRDISFENPNAPDSLRGGLVQPELDVNIGMDARKITDVDGMPNLYETVLKARAEAKRGVKVVFIAEVQYGMVVSVGEAVAEENHHPLLLIEIPRLAFPFVRQIMSDLTTQGGYPPLMLAPVDFYSLYMQRFGSEIEKFRKDLEKDVLSDLEKNTE